MTNAAPSYSDVVIPEREDDAFHWVHKRKTISLCGLSDLERTGRVPGSVGSSLALDICPLCDALYGLLPSC